MKTSIPLQIALAAALLPALAFAAKPGKPDKKKAAPDGTPAVSDVLKSYDKNGNQQIDSDELAALQNTFAQFRKLDQNANGEIEPSEVEPPKKAATDDRKSRAMSSLKKVDKNANGKIDSEEVEGLQKVLAGSKIMEKLDRDGNGKLESNELERLNERLAQGGMDRKSQKPGSKPTPPPAATKPPAKPAEKSDFEATKPEEKKTEDKKPEIKKAEPKDPAKEDPFTPKDPFQPKPEAKA